MEEKVYFPTEPEAILYMPLPNGMADVWLRKNIGQEANDDFIGWVADETYFRTTLSYEEVEADFDTLFTNGWAEEMNEDEDSPTLANRVAVLEATLDYVVMMTDISLDEE